VDEEMAEEQAHADDEVSAFLLAAEKAAEKAAEEALEEALEEAAEESAEETNDDAAAEKAAAEKAAADAEESGAAEESEEEAAEDAAEDAPEETDDDAAAEKAAEEAAEEVPSKFVCVQCGEPTLDGKLTCEACRERLAAERAEKMMGANAAFEKEKAGKKKKAEAEGKAIEHYYPEVKRCKDCADTKRNDPSGKIHCPEHLAKIIAYARSLTSKHCGGEPEWTHV
jgi:hypothetical protein